MCALLAHLAHLGHRLRLFLRPFPFRHDREDILVVGLAAPPSAATDVPNTKLGLSVDAPYERLFKS
jgi:hypothetical protein